MGEKKCINHFTNNKLIIQDLTIYLEYVQQSRYINLIYIKLSIHFDIQFLLESSKHLPVITNLNILHLINDYVSNKECCGCFVFIKS